LASFASPPIQYILFDFDGTLLDTERLINEAIRYACRETLGLEPTEAQILAGWAQPIEDRMKAFGADHVPELVKRYIEFSDRNAERLSKPFPGVERTLSALEAGGYVLAVVTQKKRPLVVRSLSAFGLDPFLREIVTRDEVERAKPAPDAALEALSRLDGSPQAALVVGDTDLDIGMGRAAGCRVCAAMWGAVDPEALRGLHPDYSAERPEDLLGFLPPLTRSR